MIELVGDDFRFRGLFTCGACGSRPIRIWHYGLRRFEVVTEDFPARIRSHARRMRAPLRARAAPRRGGLREGRAHAMAADLCLLERCGAGFRLVRAASGAASSTAAAPFDVSPLGARTCAP